jgi:hypothetical protein
VLTAFAGVVGAEAPRPLGELDALRIGKLYAERQVFEQALLKLQAQQESLRVQTQSTRREYEAKNAELQAAIGAAAAGAGLSAADLAAGWQPAPEERRWIKVEPAKP